VTDPVREPFGSLTYQEWLKPLAKDGASGDGGRSFQAGWGRGRQGLSQRIGGKGASLAKLAQGGFPVPRAWAIEARHFTRFVSETLPRGHDVATLVKLAGTRVGIERAARARDRVLSERLPEGLEAALAMLWSEIERDAPWGMAVRSSATCEDSEETSLAGLAVTMLGVRGPEDLGAAVRQVWASAFLPRAIMYLAHADIRELAMGVVVQVMVRAEAAGVLFTAPPPGLAGDHWRANERLINATLGLGAPVVEGAMPADTVRIARDGGAVVASVVAEKRRALVVGDHGLMEVAVPEGKATAPALGPEALRELAWLVARLEEGATGPLDVEFAVEGSGSGGGGERVWLLQVRPIRGAGYPEGGDEETVWSRANVGEALPGAATPLTWSIARAFSDRGFREAFAALGCRVPKSARLVSNVHGRFYLNLTAFMQIAAQVPGLTPRALLSMSGGANEAAITALTKQAEGISKRRFFMRLPLTAARLLARQARLEKDVAAYEVDAERARRALGEMDLTLLPDDALATTMKSALRLLEKTGTLMLHCASASLAAHLALCRAVERGASKRASARDALSLEEDFLRADDGAPPGRAPHIAQTLASGVRELDSANPGVELARVAEIANRDEAAKERLSAGQVRSLSDLPRGPLREALAQFLDAFGDRAVREAELATPRWREEPGPVIAMLMAAMRAPPGEPARALARARALADREMAQLETRVSAVEVAIVRALVERAQRFTRLRERMRTWVTRVLGMLRAIALDVDRRLRRIDPSLRAGSVFYCTHEELMEALSSGRAEVGPVVRLRLAEHLRDAARPDPPASFIGRPPAVTLPPVKGTRLVGLPASGGVVEGPARVLEPGATGLDAVNAGEVLVSRTTDVGLSPLFLVAAAVVTELGGPLSHAAVVAREYGIPAVVSVPGATVAIRTGDRVRVDGDRGIVEKLDERAAAPGAPPSPPDVR
jgi:pyruvate,water dikinase